MLPDDSLFRWDSVWQISVDPRIKVRFPVRQYVGKDERDIRYKDYVLEAEYPGSAAERNKNYFGKHFYVWRNGNWKNKWVYLDNRTVELSTRRVQQEKLPRSICQFRPGELAWNGHVTFSTPTIMLVVEIQPGGPYTRFYSRKLIVHDDNPRWFNGPELHNVNAYSDATSPSWKLTTFEEITAALPHYALPIVEANLLL